MTWARDDRAGDADSIQDRTAAGQDTPPEGSRGKLPQHRGRPRDQHRRWVQDGDPPTAHVVLSGTVGSTAYGLAGADSDVDQLGVFAAPTAAVLGLHPPRDSIVTTHPDRTLHEAAKYVRLALAGNPTATEAMWLPAYAHLTPLGQELIGIRRAFASAPRCRDAYLGYATRQFRRLEARGDGSFSADTRKRTAKHARHLMRLCVQGFHLYATGELVIRLDNPGDFHALGDRVADGDIEAARALITEYAHRFDSTPTVLPDQPDEAPVEAWLLRVRREFW